ncbi:MAG TPA: hypothetical protein VHS52_00080 [Acidimicrobiales bacterium]|nr:hypothetical protein [Acidimicrobiales bacterium]
MRRLLATATILLATALVLCAGPAWAHEEINPSSFPSGKPVFLTLTAANEKEVDLVKITLAGPTGAPPGESTRQPQGWNVEHGDGTVTWSGGTVKPQGYEQWGFEVDGVAQPGPLQYKVTLGFADGQTEESDVVINAVAPDAAPAGATTTVVAPANSAREAATSTSSGSGKANAALAVAIVAGVVAVAAVALAARRRSPVGQTTRSATQEQDF